MDEHFIVVFSLDVYPYPKQKAFQFMAYELYRREPPPPKKKKKNQVQLKKKVNSLFPLGLQKTSIYQITMYAFSR